MVRASLAAEEIGIRAVSIVAAGFVDEAKSTAAAQGAPDLQIAEYPNVIMTDSDDELGRLSASLADKIVAGLTATMAPTADAGSDRADTATVYRGTFDEVQTVFQERLWSDGLPIVPPTNERVESFLRFTDRNPDDTIGIAQPANQRATVRSVAVNGVMAGCRPEHMPVLIAVVECITDPRFHLEDGGSTGGWEPLIAISGPIAAELDFAHGQGVGRIGRQANTTVGRFLRLYMRNVAGLRVPPGTNDMATFGFNFRVALAEDEQCVRELGWQPYSVDRGFAAGDNVVTVQSCIGESWAVASSGDKGLGHLETITEVVARGTWSHLVWCGWWWGELHPLLVMSPNIARVLAADGWTKDRIRTYFGDNVHVTARSQETQAVANGWNQYSVAGFVEEGRLPEEYALSADPDRLIPAFTWPEDIGIIVAGDPHRNRSIGFAQHGRQGSPVSKKVVLPAKWGTGLRT